MRHALVLLFVFAGFLSSNVSAQNRASNYDFLQRAEAREAQRWTLAEWMAQKEKNRMMDLWLAFNSPSPYEFMLGWGHKAYDQTQSINSVESKNSWVSSQSELHAYASIMGLSAEYENNLKEKYNDLTGMLNLRVFGNSIQNSHLTLHYGQRTRERDFAGTKTRFGQNFAQASLQLYLSPYFGIDSKYRTSLGSQTSESIEAKSFTLQEAGLFIDFKGIRIFGNWYQEKETLFKQTTSEIIEESRTGIKSGLKIFF